MNLFAVFILTIQWCLLVIILKPVLKNELDFRRAKKKAFKLGFEHGAQTAKMAVTTFYDYRGDLNADMRIVSTTCREMWEKCDEHGEPRRT